MRRVRSVVWLVMGTAAVAGSVVLEVESLADWCGRPT